MYPKLSGALHRQRNELAPDTAAAFKAFSESVFADVTQCPYCINGHTERALHKGASQQEVMEAIWVAAEMRAGGAYAHSNLALDTMNKVASTNGSQNT